MATPSTAAAKTRASDPVLKAIQLLESLHAMPKCKCNGLRQELADIKKAIETPLSSPPSDTYAVVKKALSDATTYADKSCRAVCIGREEGLSPTETSSADQKDIEELCKQLNDDVITQALSDGTLLHHRHPEIKGDRKKRPLKIKFASPKIRDRFLSLVRSTRPSTVTKSGGTFIRRDLCPFELELERQARVEANNCKL